MSRLPKPGSDQGKWGEILNDYLSQAHTDTGTLKPGVVATSTLTDSAVTNTKLADNSVTTAKLQDNSVTTAKLASAGQPSGIATLDTNGKLPDSQVPTRLGEEELSGLVVATVDVETPSIVARDSTRLRGVARVSVLGDSHDASQRGWFPYFTIRGANPRLS